MPRQGDTVSMRVHPSIKAAIDYFIAQYRAETGKGLTNDEAIWMMFENGAKDATEAVIKMGAERPTDKRIESLKARHEEKKRQKGD